MNSSDPAPSTSPPLPPLKCGKCSASMDEGFLAEYVGGAKRVATWVAGAPEFGWAGNVKTKEHEELYVQVFRCTQCGHLEFFAPRNQ